MGVTEQEDRSRQASAVPCLMTVPDLQDSVWNVCRVHIFGSQLPRHTHGREAYNPNAP